jgi:hypothetical protein
MTVRSAPMYWAQCDYPGCEVATRDYEGGNHIIYDTPELLTAEFDRPSWAEGGLCDDYGWLRVGEQHFCGDHTEWDDEDDKRVPVRSEGVS